MKNYLTLDIGGTEIKYGVINEDEKLLYKNITPTNGHLGGNNIIKTIKELYHSLNNEYQLEGIAIASTGAIDMNGQMLTPSISIIDFEKINFKRDLRDLNVLVSAENDVKCMALCEKDLVPNYQKLNTIVALTIGTGIGGAIIFNNELYRGFSYTAGEVGRMFITNENNFEEIAATNSLVENAQKFYPHIKNGIDVFNYYDNKDVNIIPVVDKFYNDLATGIANIIYILNPEHIIIGGGITNRGDRFINELDYFLKPKLWDYLQDKYTLSIAKHKNDAGMIGAFKYFKQLYLEKKC